jgi:arylsulfatase A-like enzyme
MGDNGTGKGQQEYSTIGGRNLSGMKGSMQECGGLVPFIANWPGKTPSGKICQDLIDSTDLLATFSGLTENPLPTGTVVDGHSFAPQLLGQTGHPREWIFNQLAAMWYVRDARWKLHVLPGQDPRAKLRDSGANWVDPRAPDGVTILAPFEQYKPSDHPGLTTGVSPAPMQLFDLEADPSEQHDVSAAQPETVARLRKLSDELTKDAPASRTSPTKAGKTKS